MGVEWLCVMCNWQVVLVDNYANEFAMLKMGMLNSKFHVLYAFSFASAHGCSRSRDLLS